MLSNCPSFTKVGPRSSQTRRSRRGRSCWGTSFPSATRSIGRTIPSRWSAGDDVLITVAHQGREDLPITRQVSEMADRFANHVTPPCRHGDGRGADAFSCRSLARASSRLDRMRPGQLPAVFILQSAAFWLNYLLCFKCRKWMDSGNIHADSTKVTSGSYPRIFRGILRDAVGGHRIHFPRDGHGMPTASLMQAARRPTCCISPAVRKLEKVGDNETKIWFRSVRVAIKHLDELIGHQRWKWCKICEREITQRILDEN